MTSNRSKETPILAWHFLPNDMRLKHGDRRLVEVGKTLSVKGDIIPCDHGLHASRRVLDALGYADNNALVVCRVECWGDVAEKSDKLACRHRRVLWMFNAEKLLHQFAVDIAREALDAYAKDSDDPKVQKANVLHRNLLDLKQRWINGDLMDVEWNAAWNAARVAARVAAWNAARNAALAAAWNAAWNAALAAAWNAAWNAARVAAWNAAWNAARVAARVAAWNAARERINNQLEAMLYVEAERLGMKAVQS